MTKASQPTLLWRSARLIWRLRDGTFAPQSRRSQRQRRVRNCPCQQDGTGWLNVAFPAASASRCWRSSEFWNVSSRERSLGGGGAPKGSSQPSKLFTGDSRRGHGGLKCAISPFPNCRDDCEHRASHCEERKRNDDAKATAGALLARSLGHRHPDKAALVHIHSYAPCHQLNPNALINH